MAQSLSKADSPPDKTHNLTAIKGDLLKAAKQIKAKQDRIAGIREEISEIKSTMVKAHGIKLADFATVMRWWNLEDEDRDQTLDNIRICAEALGVGAQADMFPSEGAVKAAKAGVGDAERTGSGDAEMLAEARAAGAKAAEDGAFGDDASNPYEDGTAEAAAWAEGWQGVQAARAKALDKGKAGGKSAAAH